MKTKSKLPDNWKPCTEGIRFLVIKTIGDIYTVNNSTKIYNWTILGARLYKPNYPIKQS